MELDRYMILSTYYRNFTLRINLPLKFQPHDGNLWLMVNVTQLNPHDYKVSPPSSGSGIDRSRMPFEFVMHTSHILTAVNIIRSKKINAGLVYDESQLNSDRILVNWLSPNTWDYRGYRYGTIQFIFSFDQLITRKKFYCVEVVEYKIPAVRILISSRDHSGNSILSTYDPYSDDGPWVCDKSSNTHYYNNHCCLEFMFEEDIPLSDLVSLKFVDHSIDYCNENRKSPKFCPEFKMDGGTAGSIFLSRLISEGIEIADLKLRDNANGSRGGLGVAWDGLTIRIKELGVVYSSNGNLGSRDYNALCHSFLSALARSSDNELITLASLFPSRDELILGCRKIIAQAMKIDEGLLPI